VYIVQSDASDVEGFGYFHSYLNDTEIHYVSKRWDGSLEDPCNLMCFELRFLSDFLDTTSIRDCVLIWLNDNEASTHGVNKGSCKDPASRILLFSILQILAIWVPGSRTNLLNRVFRDYQHI